MLGGSFSITRPIGISSMCSQGLCRMLLVFLISYCAVMCACIQGNGRCRLMMRQHRAQLDFFAALHGQLSGQGQHPTSSARVRCCHMSRHERAKYDCMIYVLAAPESCGLPARGANHAHSRESTQRKLLHYVPHLSSDQTKNLTYNLKFLPGCV